MPLQVRRPIGVDGRIEIQSTDTNARARYKMRGREMGSLLLHARREMGLQNVDAGRHCVDVNKHLIVMGKILSLHAQNIGGCPSAQHRPSIGGMVKALRKRVDVKVANTHRYRRRCRG